jgi:hypothetical protein
MACRAAPGRIARTHRPRRPRHRAGNGSAAGAVGRSAATGSHRPAPRSRAEDPDSRRLDRRARCIHPGQVLNLLADIRDQSRMSYVLISHDLAVVRQLTDETIVMPRGRWWNAGPTGKVLHNPGTATRGDCRPAVPRPGYTTTHGSGAARLRPAHP